MKKTVPVAVAAPTARAARKPVRARRARAEAPKTPVARKVAIRTKVSKATSAKKGPALVDLIKALLAADASSGVTAVEALRLAVDGQADAAEHLARAAAEAGASAMEAAWVASLPDAGDALAYLSARPA